MTRTSRNGDLIKNFHSILDESLKQEEELREVQQYQLVQQETTIVEEIERNQGM